jgi:hypothetical protein
MCATNFLNLNIISINNKDIEDKPIDSKFIYHYSENVKKFLANKILANPQYVAHTQNFSN